MPKSNRTKKNKAADFSKAKLRLGKGRQGGTNAVDTSFKARSITVPYQTIIHEQGGSKLTTRRKLTLDDLLLRLKHYNPSTRKDAIWGLRELFDTHSALLETSLTSVIQACARVVGDEDAEVRKALLAFIAWFLRQAPLHQIRPHIPTLILFITSTQTHIFPAIRIDAVRLLDVLLDITPEMVTRSWSVPQSTGARVLEGYLGLLNAGSQFWAGGHDHAPAPSTSNITLSPNSKLVVLSSLSSFLKEAVSSPHSQFETASSFWYMASSFSTRAEFISFCSLIHPRHSTISEDSVNDIEWFDTHRSDTENFVGTFDCAWGSLYSDEFSLGELGDVGKAVDLLMGDSKSSQSNSTTSCIAHLVHTLHPILVSTWLDVAPVVFGPNASGDEFNTRLAISVVQISRCLYGAIFKIVDLPADIRSLAFDELTALLGYMSTYLPWISTNGETQSEVFSRDLSFAYCELTSLALVASQSFSASGTSRSKTLSTQIDRVAQYVIKVLEGELSSASQPLGYSLTASAYAMLSPTIWSLLKYQTTPDSTTISSRIRLACINHALCTSSKSSSKGMATQFIGLQVLLYSQHGGPITSYTTAELRGFREWFLQLPKVLWEVGTSNLSLTEVILRLFLRVAQRRAVPFDISTSEHVRSRLIPYFATVHPEKGRIQGPFTKLQQWPRLCRLALNVAAVLLQDADVADPLRTAVDNAVRDTEEAQYWSTLQGSN